MGQGSIAKKKDLLELPIVVEHIHDLNSIAFYKNN